MKPFWICLIVLSFIAPLTSGVQKETAQPSTDQPPSFSLSIKASQGTYKLGSDAVIEVTITNTSGHDLFASVVAMDVRDSAGKLAPLVQGRPGVPPGGSLVAYPLKPGQSMEGPFNLKTKYAITAPGRYTVQAWREDYDPGTHKVRGRVKSNILTIDVVK